MADEFSEKVVVITGTAGDIGRQVARTFGDRGAEVYQTDIRELDVPNFTSGDISSPEFVSDWITKVVDETGRIDVLVNSAAICPRTPLMQITADQWDQVLGVNLRSTFLVSQAVMKTMLAQEDGAIVNLASLAGKVGGIAVGAHYSASKIAITALTKALARTGAPCGVRANAVAPGIIDNAMGTSAGPEAVEKQRQSIPMQRLGSVDEVVQPILFLASSAASYVTGTTLDINGGMLMD